MPITSSAFTLGPAQADGRRWVKEVHQANGNGSVIFNYLAPANADHASIMAARVAGVNEELREAEARLAITRDVAPVLVHQTGTQFLVRLREMFRGADREFACCLAWWLLRRIAAGDLTDAQARAPFGYSAAQWTTLKSTKLQPRADAWAQIIAATGE